MSLLVAEVMCDFREMLVLEFQKCSSTWLGAARSRRAFPYPLLYLHKYDQLHLVNIIKTFLEYFSTERSEAALEALLSFNLY